MFFRVKITKTAAYKTKYKESVVIKRTFVLPANYSGRRMEDCSVSGEATNDIAAVSSDGPINTDECSASEVLANVVGIESPGEDTASGSVICTDTPTARLNR